jgi:hypothetical protein
MGNQIRTKKQNAILSFVDGGGDVYKKNGKKDIDKDLQTQNLANYQEQENDII